MKMEKKKKKMQFIQMYYILSILWSQTIALCEEPTEMKSLFIATWKFVTEIALRICQWICWSGSQNQPEWFVPKLEFSSVCPVAAVNNSQDGEEYQGIT